MTTFHSSDTWAVILAAGSGNRMAKAGIPLPKQFLTFRDTPLFWHSASVFAASPSLKGLIFVFPKHYLDFAEQSLQALTKEKPLGLPWKIVAGGALRQDSVYNALQTLPPECQYVLLHDAARPFLTPHLVERVLIPLQNGEAQGVIPGLPVTDTIKEVSIPPQDTSIPDDPSAATTPLSHETVLRTIERTPLRAVQTPQAFQRIALRHAHEEARQKERIVTDDAAMMEDSGFTVVIVPGESTNMKITTPDDLRLLETPQEPSHIPCTGFGYDVHRFGSGRPLKLGGIAIPNAPEIVAHSDGDVLLHALMDALLGCAALGDIGEHFPDTAQAYDNISSVLLLDEVLERIRKRNIQPVHVDMTIVTQTPKIAPFRENIRKNVARLLALEIQAVNLKATTEEGLGFTGAKEGIKAFAQVTAWRNR